jgi:hypothetical protein
MVALADWDPRLMSPERALRLVGDTRLYIGIGMARLSQFAPEGGGEAQPDRMQVNLRCQADGQSVMLLADSSDLVLADNVTSFTMGEMLSAVLRHLVMAHDVSLSGSPDG